MHNRLVTGLATAYELAKYAVETKASLEITVIEKENRLGGRIKTVGKSITRVDFKKKRVI